MVTISNYRLCLGNALLVRHPKQVYVKVETLAVLGLHSDKHPRLAQATRVHPGLGAGTIGGLVLDADARNANGRIDVDLYDQHLESMIALQTTNIYWTYLHCAIQRARSAILHHRVVRVDVLVRLRALAHIERLALAGGCRWPPLPQVGLFDGRMLKR